MSYRSDISTYSSTVPRSAHARMIKFDRMHTSPSLDRLNTSCYDRTPYSSSKSMLQRQRTTSYLDLRSNIDYGIPNATSSLFSHRNPTISMLRDSSLSRYSDQTSSSYYSSPPRSRQRMNGHTSHSPTPPRHLPFSSALTRDLYSSSSSRMTPSRSSIHRSQHWHVSPNTDIFRPRIRERPILSNLNRSMANIRTTPMSPLVKSTTSNYDTSNSSSISDSAGIIRNRFMIKFREHNLNQTPEQRRSSITWDLNLPASINGSTSLGLSSMIAEQCEPNIQSQQEINERNKLDRLIAGERNEQIENECVLEKSSEMRIADSSSSSSDVVSQNQTSSNIELHSHSLKTRAACLVAERVSKEVLNGLMIMSVERKGEDEKVKIETPVLKKEEKKSPKKKIKKKDSPKAQVNVEAQRNNVNIINEITKMSVRSLNDDIKNEKDKDKDKDKDKEKEKEKEKVKTNRKIIPKDKDNNQPKIKKEKRVKFRKYTFDDFNLLKVLGRGSFGKVLLVELKNNAIHFALKCLKKHSVIEDDDVDSTMIERKVLAFGSIHPFICTLFCTFQTESYLCFVMEWCCGGDLMFHVQKCGKFNEERARFYASEIICAIKFLHKKHIIYRDLKLDNLMLDSKGHIRLVDFGMCQGKIYREEFLPSNFCGTPEYMAPEIIKGVKYNQSVDFWSLGVVIYEMVVGTSPFHGTDEDELLWNVCYETVNYPKYLSEVIKNLLVQLMDRNSETRLGMPTSPNGDLCQHQFFIGVEWDKVEKCQVKPPFVPLLKSSSDVQYFDEEFIKETPNLTPVDPAIIQSFDQELFKGFSYTNPAMTD